MRWLSSTELRSVRDLGQYPQHAIGAMLIACCETRKLTKYTVFVQQIQLSVHLSMTFTMPGSGVVIDSEAKRVNL
jgi:hypothetical protein